MASEAGEVLEAVAALEVDAVSEADVVLEAAVVSIADLKEEASSAVFVTTMASNTTVSNITVSRASAINFKSTH